MVVREDDINLYGFTDKASLAMFKLLIGVSGIGAKAALSILGVAPVSAIKQAIIFEDLGTIQAANGVGKKTAQRVILELKDKVQKSSELSFVGEAPKPQSSGEDRTREHALDAVGYKEDHC